MGTASSETVFVLDDEAAIRDSLRFLLESVGLRVETFADAGEFLASWSPERPGCLVLDVRMRGMSGLELQDELVRRGVHLPTIVITGHGDVPMAVRAMKSGALDFLQKPFGDQALVDRVHQALEIDRDARRDLAERTRVSARLSILTPREREIAELLVDGKANKEIASDLGLSTRTVEGHRAHIMDKLAVDSFAELVRLVLVSRGEKPAESVAAREPATAAPRP